MKNQMSDLNIQLNNEAAQYRKKRYEELVKNAVVIAFLETHQLPNEFVWKHLSKFDRWIKMRNRDPKFENYYQPGYEMELQFTNGFLDFVYIQNKSDAIKEKQLSHLKYYRVNHLPDPMKLNSFRTLSLNRESNHYLKIVEEIQKISLNDKGIYLHGSIGSGKTHLMACLTNDMARKKNTVGFVRMSELLAQLKSLFEDDGAYNQLMSGLMFSKLLVIDDIGSENVTQWGRDEILFNVLNHRMENKLLTCFTSNLNFLELKEVYLKQQYGVVDENKVERLMERITTLAKPLYLHGVSRRK